MGKGLQKGRYQTQGTRFDTLDTDGNRLRARLQSTSSSYYVESPRTLRTGRWYHAAVSFIDSLLAELLAEVPA